MALIGPGGVSIPEAVDRGSLVLAGVRGYKDVLIRWSPEDLVKYAPIFLGKRVALPRNLMTLSHYLKSTLTSARRANIIPRFLILFLFFSY